MMMASMFGDGPPPEDSKLFENKYTIIHKLDASNADLLGKLRFLYKPKLENRILVTLFYHRSHSSKAMDILQHFDKEINFANPENDFCPHWNYESDAMSPFFRLCTKKWPEGKYCLAVASNFEIQSDKKSNNVAIERVDSVKLKNGFGRYKLFALYEDKKGTKLMRVYLSNTALYGTDYLTLKDVSDEQYNFIIFKVFDDSGDFFYISPVAKPDRYVYMRANGSGDVVTYDGVKNRPTEQSYWVCMNGTK